MADLFRRLCRHAAPPRRDGYIGGIDHFGIVVDDIEGGGSSA
jgi:hypothetical protein